MQDSSAWSISLGRWGGVHLRLHALFLLFAIFAIYLSTQTGQRDLVWFTGLSLAILFLSVLIHELAHAFAAFRLGGHAEEIVIGPFGGLAHVSVPHDPKAELITTIAGPIANLILCLLVVPALVVGGETSLMGLLDPLHPQNLVEGSPLRVGMQLVFWLNWVLVLLNVLPAYPFDGGRALRAALWPLLGYRHAVVVVGRVAKVTAILICIFAWWFHDPAAGGLVHPWVPLVLIAIFLFFSAKHEVARGGQQELGEDLFGYDFSQGYTSLEREHEVSRAERSGWLKQWIERRREEREQRIREQEAAEERRVDDILARLHGEGIQNLSAEDRALLDRVSARYRNRSKP